MWSRTTLLCRKKIKNEKGMTLIEVLIGILLFSLILLSVSGWMAHWNKTSQLLKGTIEARTAYENAVRIMREDVRTSSEVTETGEELRFLKGKQEDVTYFLSGKRNLIRSLNGQGASVIATDVEEWRTEPIGRNAVQVFLAIEKSGSRWKQTTVLAGRGSFVEEEAALLQGSK